MPLICFFGSISLFLPSYLVTTYVIWYTIILTLTALILVLRVYRHHKDQDFRYALLRFIIALMLFWAGGISWMLFQESGFPNLQAVANILIIAAYAFFIYLCLEVIKDNLHRVSNHVIFQIFAGNAILYILFSTPLLYSVLSKQRPFLDVVISFIHPVLDIILFTFVLLLLTLYFKKMVGYHWFWICMSFLLIIGGDMVYTYYSVLGIQSLYLLTNAFYGVAYGILVIGLLLISAKSELVPPIFANSDK